MPYMNNPPYYMTAYGLAVKHGYRGTEEQWLADLKYPVGAIYLSVENTSPGVLFGGTWVEIEDQILLTAGEDYTAGSFKKITVAAGTQADHNGVVVYAWKRTK